MLLFLLLSTESFSQYAKMKAGITLGYQKLGAGKWHELFSAYNEASPETGAIQPKFKGGISYGAFFSYTITDGITLTPEINLVSFKSTSTDSNYDLDLKAKFMDISLHGDFYFLKFLSWSKGIQPEDAPDRFFGRASLTYSKFSFAASGTAKGGGDVSAVTGTGGAFRFGLGLGYHFYINDQFSVTPVLNLSYGSGTAQGLSEAILPAGTSGGADKSTTFRRGLELKIGYTIKPYKPLCPIADCRIAQEHRHPSLFGDVLVRGNPYSLRQNPRHGQKHRGGDRKKLTEKLKRKEAKKKAKEEKERLKAEEAKKAEEETVPTEELPAEEPPQETETPTDPPEEDPEDDGI